MEESSRSTTRRRVLRMPARRQIIRLMATVFATVAALQAITIFVLTAVDKRRRSRLGSVTFPHDELPEVSVDGNMLQIYTYGREVYEAMLAAIDAAVESIYFETFIWKNDAVGREFKEHLIRKADEGVAVYVIFDSFGNLVVPRAFKQFPSNVHVLRYRAIRRLRHLLRPRRYALDHRKLLIVDGRVAFIGGYNIGSLYATEWRDTHLRISGADAGALAQAFVDFWDRNASRTDAINRRYKRRFNSTLLVRSNDAMRLTFPIRDMYLNGIDAAERDICLTSAYFIPDHILLDSLKRAAARGVNVQVLVPWISNHIVAD